MIYSKEIVREWLDEVAERAKDHPEWWMSLSVAIQTPWTIRLNPRRWFNFCLDWGYSCYVASGFDSPTQTLPSCG